ncbi:hypothetical protein Q7P37_006896 [Cladosporium fusiforme]
MDPQQYLPVQRYENIKIDGNARVHNGNTYNNFPQPAEPSPEPLSTIPFPRDSDYVHREQLEDEIHEKLSAPGARVALVGLGGLGKSQLAIEYSYRLREQSPEWWVVWIHASNVARFEQSVRDALDDLKVQGRKSPDADILRLLRDWLRDDPARNWLVILDNVDDAGFLLDTPAGCSGRRIDYLPPCAHGRLLITSRDETAALKVVDRKSSISVTPMSSEQASALVQIKIGNSHSHNDMMNLTKSLDSVPLAITQATAYIAHRAPRCTVQQYIEKVANINKSTHVLLDHDSGDLRRDREARNSIFLTWHVSIEHIGRIRPSAADLLFLMSCFDRQAIPAHALRSRNLQSDVASSIHDSTVHSDSDDEDFEDDLTMLRSYSFITITADPTSFQMHRLVQLAAQNWIRQQNRLEYWQSYFVRNLDLVFPKPTRINRRECRALFPHGILALNATVVDPDGVRHYRSLLKKCWHYAGENGAFASALRFVQRLSQVMQQLYGAEHPATLNIMRGLASAIGENGNYKEAVEAGEEVLDLCLKVHGEEHKSTITAMGALASSYYLQGQAEKALALGKKAHTSMVRIYGEEHPKTLISMQHLARSYHEIGRLEEAADMTSRVLEIQKRTLDPEHPQTLWGMHALACIYLDLKMYGQAEELAARTLTASINTHGEETPFTLSTMATLGTIYSCLGAHERAKGLLRKSSETMRSVVGEDHPHTLNLYSDFARCLFNAGSYGEAKVLAEQVFERRKRVLGDDHFDTEQSADLLESILRKQEPE